MIRRAGFRIFRDLAIWMLVLAIVFPLFWMISTAFKPDSETFALPPTLLPHHPTIEQFVRLFSETPIALWFVNSVIVALLTTVVVVVVALAGAYALVRFRFPFRRGIAEIVLATYLLPTTVLLLPLYIIIARIGLANSLFGLALAYITFTLPFALWLLRGFIVGIPVDLEEAAMVDGAGRIGAFVEIVIPQALPGIISTAIFSFILSWNEYLYAMVFINETSRKTLPPGVLSMLNQNQNVQWALLMAASVVMALPLVISFAFLQSHLSRGFGAGAVKG